MDYKKINKLREEINKNKKKLSVEKDYKKRRILGLKMKIDGLKIEMERNK